MHLGCVLVRLFDLGFYFWLGMLLLFYAFHLLTLVHLYAFHLQFQLSILSEVWLLKLPSSALVWQPRPSLLQIRNVPARAGDSVVVIAGHQSSSPERTHAERRGQLGCRRWAASAKQAGSSFVFASAQCMEYSGWHSTTCSEKSSWTKATIYRRPQKALAAFSCRSWRRCSVRWREGWPGLILGFKFFIPDMRHGNGKAHWTLTSCGFNTKLHTMIFIKSFPKHPMSIIVGFIVLGEIQSKACSVKVNDLHRFPEACV